MFKEFKEFALRGNVVDMAVGIIIGAAFGKIVSSLVTDIIMPPIGLLTGGIDFSDMFINLSSTQYATLSEAQRAGAATINYGVFLNAVVNFLIVASAIFIMIKQINRLKRTEESKPATTKVCPYCKSEISIEASRCPHCTSILDKTKDIE